ncbi:MAG: ATP synthase F1 subunit delta [Acidobacteriia bacterium]|nr:ATP synthase F1 subunit delta [Terriglobia bacterium]
MKDRLLAKRYAKALLAAIDDPASAERVDAFLGAIASAAGTSAELRDVLLNPAVPRQVRRKVLGALARERQAPPFLASFLAVVADHGRADALPAIAEAFRAIKDEAAGVVPATLTTAAPLPADLVARARAVLEKLTARRVFLTCVVEPSLLGGAVTRIGSTVYDGSLSTQLGALRRRMAEE